MFSSKAYRGRTKTVDRIPEEAQRILQEGFFAYMGTVEEGCNPHVTAMFFIWDRDSETLLLISSEANRKVRNIKKNPNVCVTIDERDPDSPAGNEGVMIRGKAELLELGIVDEIWVNQYLQKYLDFLGYGFPLGERIAIRIVPRSLSYWKGTKFCKWKNPR